MVVDAKRVLNFVTLASATGKYGGPYDTSLRQAVLTSHLGCDNVLFAGVLQGDEPVVDTGGVAVRVAFHKVRRILPVRGFVGLHSCRALRALSAEIANCDIVHVSVARELMPISAVILTLLHRKHLIVQTHGMMTSRTSIIHKVLDLLIRPMLSKAHSVIALTTVEAEELTTWFGSAPHDITVLGNPVPSDVMPRGDGASAEGDVVFIARLHPRKRVDLFVGAAAVASNKGWTEKYTVVGPDEGDLEIVLSAGRKLSNLAYEGTLTSSAVTERVRNSDVFVLSSEREPWGNVLAIAIASGIPVVIPESAALADRVREYGAGIVVPDNDASAIAQAVHALLNDPELYAAAILGAGEFARCELSKTRQVTAFEKLYALSSANRCGNEI